MIQVAPNLYRGPRPQDLRPLQAMGIKRIINLEWGIYEFFNHDTYKREEQHPADFGMELIHVPMNDFTAPTKSEVMNVIHDIINSMKPTYFHCLTGKDRTGYVCAVYRMLIDKWPYDRAIGEMFALGFHKFPYYFWTWSLKEYAR